MKNEYYRHSDAKSMRTVKFILHSFLHASVLPKPLLSLKRTAKFSLFFVRFGFAEAPSLVKESSKIQSFFLYASVLPKPLLSLVSYINQPIPIHRHTFALSDDGKTKLTELLEVPFSIRTIGLSPIVAVS